MGRKRTVNRDLPPRLYLKLDGYYYRHPNGKEQRVGKTGELSAALIKWAEFEGVRLDPSAITFDVVADAFRDRHLPKVAERTQTDYKGHLTHLSAVFGPSALDTITPVDVAAYRDKRSAKVQANREIAVLSVLWNFAREAGYTKEPNPCAGIKRNKETGRRRYLTDAEFTAIHGKASQEVQDAMMLALYTGQQIGDLLRAKRSMIQGGELVFVRQKTDVAVRYRIIGRLKMLLAEMTARPRSATGQWLIQSNKGQRINYRTFALHFAAAAKAAGVADVQFRDIRPKVATDLPDIERAKDTLGHSKIATTERHYIRRGKLVNPAS